MQVFVTGATGYIGFAVSAGLRRAGYRVWGLARSEKKARRLAQHEIEPVIGDLGDPKTYLDVASECALLVHTGFDYSANGVAKDRTAIDTLLEAGRRAPSPRRSFSRAASGRTATRATAWWTRRPHPIPRSSSPGDLRTSKSCSRPVACGAWSSDPATSMGAPVV